MSIAYALALKRDRDVEFSTHHGNHLVGAAIEEGGGTVLWWPIK